MRRKTPDECLNPYDWANCYVPPWPNAPTVAGRVGQMLAAAIMVAGLLALCLWLAV